VQNEAANILPLIHQIEAALVGIPYEIVYVDDGSTDETPARLQQAWANGAPLRIIRHKTSCGQSAGVVTGVKHSRGTWIATLDGIARTTRPLFLRCSCVDSLKKRTACLC
jgi:dolichol-phosphate mannosyltransferase